MPWYVKHETFRQPYAMMQPHLAAHRAWVAELRGAGVRISSGYLVDSENRPGGGGLQLLEAEDFASALALIEQDPMVRSGGVDWSLQRWVEVEGGLETTGTKAL